MLVNTLKFDSRFRIVAYKKDVLTKYSLSAKVRKWTILLVLKNYVNNDYLNFQVILATKLSNDYQNSENYRLVFLSCVVYKIN